ncbi:acetoin reductase family protein [Rhizopogon salebrosus TDB-379]|nr:acetoin reductase family protein [Rhizopogon salebrosus TDB-379]
MSDIPSGVALITGAAHGLGRSIALRLATDGFDIALNDLPDKHEQLSAVAKEIEGLGRKTCIVPADVSQEDQVRQMVDSVVEYLGGLDVMVANAGVFYVKPFLSTSVQVWDETMQINARGVFLCYQYAAAQMVKQGRGGRILGANAISGKIGVPGAAAYCASYFAVRGLTQSAASPVLDRFGNLFLDEMDAESKSYIAGLMQNRPLKQDGQTEDIASIVSYLASKEAHFITGQCISVDGGVIV